MREPTARAALLPILSSPWRLCTGALIVALGVFLIQISSGISPWRKIAPVELSSNVVAAMAFVWTVLQIRTYRHAAFARRSWILFAISMALLAVEGSVGELFTLETQSRSEMSISIALWFVAAALIFAGGRRYAAKRYVPEFLLIGFTIQLVAQTIGFVAAFELSGSGSTDNLKFANDFGELLSVFAYMFALFFAEFTDVRSYGFGFAPVPAPRSADRVRGDRAEERTGAQIISLMSYLNSRRRSDRGDGD